MIHAVRCSARARARAPEREGEGKIERANKSSFHSQIKNAANALLSSRIGEEKASDLNDFTRRSSDLYGDNEG